MPLRIENKYDSLTLEQLQKHQRDGWSVMKSPHVGNQHPSNLLCAAMGIHCNMVSFTRGDRDSNFHPHVQIRAGTQHQLYDSTTWTPFARVADGQLAELYHQTAVRKRFAQAVVTTDHELMSEDMWFTEAVLRVITQTIPNLWYRSVNSEGVVSSFRDTPPKWDLYAGNVFRFSSQNEGWIIPNRAAILHDLVWQARKSRRDIVFHLSGPQMVGYVGKHQKQLSLAYDELRRELPRLPEVLTARIVPVAQCRFVAHKDDKTAVDQFGDMIDRYERTAPDKRRYFQAEMQGLALKYPELVRPIEDGQFLSQYDLDSADDLYIPPWIKTMRLSRIHAFDAMLKRNRQ